MTIVITARRKKITSIRRNDQFRPDLGTSDKSSFIPIQLLRIYFTLCQVVFAASKGTPGNSLEIGILQFSEQKHHEDLIRYGSGNTYAYMRKN